MVYPGSIYSLLMDNAEAAQFFSGLAPERKQELLDTEFKSSQELYDCITRLRKDEK